MGIYYSIIIPNHCQDWQYSSVLGAFWGLAPFAFAQLSLGKREKGLKSELFSHYSYSNIEQ
jgi:hypothetical protein